MSTYYVRASGGSDGNSGLSFADAWETIQYAENNMSSGDTVIICADGVHTISTYILFNKISLTTSPINFIGGNAVGVVDGTRPVITTTYSSSSYGLFHLSSSSMAARFKYLDIAGGYNVVRISSVDSVVFDSCTIRQASSFSAIRIDTDEPIKIIGCDIKDCSYGIYGGITPTLLVMIGNRVHGITNYGFNANNEYGNLLFDGNIFYNCGYGLYYGGNTFNSVVKNNVFFNNTYDGIHSTGYFVGMLINNIFRSNGRYGIQVVGDYPEQFYFMDYNCFSNNATAAININGGTPPGDNNVLADPLFTSEVTDEEDFTLQSGSPCLNVGLGYNG